MLKHLKKKVGLVAATLLLAGGGAVLATTPAEAAPTYTWLCNGSGSDEVIYWYNNNTNLSLGSYAAPNACDWTGDWYTDVTYVRVDVDTTGDASYGVDVDSYKIGHINYGYGPCHVGETGDSNPPDDYAIPSTSGIRYHVSRYSNCS